MDIVVLTGSGLFLLLSFLGLGVCAGFLAGLLGVGGGIVLVPGLFYIFQSHGYESASLMHVAVGTSLAVIVPTGFSSARAHWRKGAVDIDMTRRIGIGIVPGAAVGALLASHLSGATLQQVFALAVLFLAAVMAANPARLDLNIAPGKFLHGLAGFVIGALSSLIGIGGATLSVPYMSLCKMNMHRAVGTASALGLLIAVPAAIGFVASGIGKAGLPPFSFGYMNVAAWVMVALSSVLIAPLGAYFAHRAPVDILRKIFAAFMLLVALKMWAEVF
jgi:uncharacterized membrane protein YfcA